MKEIFTKESGEKTKNKKIKPQMKNILFEEIKISSKL